MMMDERHEVLVNPFTTDAVQTIAAFASLHVGICVTMCVMAELLRLHRALRVFLWVFLGLTVVATVYLGWHYFVDALGGAVLGVAGVWIAAKGTGNAFRRRAARRGQPALAIASPSRVGVVRHLGVVGVLRPRPEEPAQPVALRPRHDVQVQVRHALADGVVHRHEGPLRPQGPS